MLVIIYIFQIKVSKRNTFYFKIYLCVGFILLKPEYYLYSSTYNNGSFYVTGSEKKLFFPLKDLLVF